MAISGEKQQVVLNSQRGDPNIIHGNGCSLQTQLSKDAGKMMRSLFVGEKNANPG